MVVLRSGKVLDSCSTSKSDTTSKSKDGSDLRDVISRHPLYNLGFKWTKRKKLSDNDPALKFSIQALNFYNLTSPQKFKLLKLGNVTPVPLPRCILFHIDFTAKNIDDPAAPKETFFTEFSNSRANGFSLRLCISLGPINSMSGDRLNGCRFCRYYNNVWHPKSGGFVRGGDGFYKTVQDICDINQNNAIPDREKHLPVLKQVSRSREPRKEFEDISEQVDDASLYATEALKFYNQRRQHRNYELVNPGFVTRVILPTCLLFHVNFKAKDTDVANAPEKMFFAELTCTSGVFSCKLCRILTPRDLTLGDETGDKTNGCYYCHEFNNVRHPLMGEFVRGGDSLYMLIKGFRC